MRRKLVEIILGVLLGGMANRSAAADAGTGGLTSLDTGYTVSRVRSALRDGDSYVVAGSYEGALLGLEYDGTVLWKSVLSGFMNQDLWCEDITVDGCDEILVANADGTATRPISSVRFVAKRQSRQTCAVGLSG